MTFIKILNAEENHHGFQYKEGLNTCPYFDTTTNSNNGFHFIDLKHWLDWANYGDHYREVLSCDIVVPVECWSQWKTNEFVLGPRKEFKAFFKTEDEKFNAVLTNPKTFEFIENPSESVQRIALQRRGCFIQYIENPSEEMKLMAVTRDGLAIQYIESPSEEMKLAAVCQNGNAIKFIENPSIEIKVGAVKENRDALTKPSGFLSYFKQIMFFFYTELNHFIREQKMKLTGLRK